MLFCGRWELFFLKLHKSDFLFYRCTPCCGFLMGIFPHLFKIFIYNKVRSKCNSDIFLVERAVNEAAGVAAARGRVAWQAQNIDPPGTAAAQVAVTGPRLLCSWQRQ
jgi:hypothetical protein